MNKLKILSLPVFCFVAAFCSKSICMEQENGDNNQPKKKSVLDYFESKPGKETVSSEDWEPTAKRHVKVDGEPTVTINEKGEKTFTFKEKEINK